MEGKIITLAIHTFEKAHVLKRVLQNRGIDVHLERIENDQCTESASTRISVKIKETDLDKALAIVEQENLFSYNDKQTYKMDDGRKRILVAVDFSNYSLDACHVAFNIARQINAKVKILHVYHNIYFPTTIPFADTLKSKDEDGILDKTRKQMLDLCYKIDQMISLGELPSVNYSYSLREGIVEEEIDDFILEYKPVLLVLGTKGKGNNAANILGNVTADIIEMTNIPVLAVPEDSSIKDKSSIKHLAFLTNFQKRDLASFDTLTHFINHYDDVKVTLVHINRINKKGDKFSEAELLRMKDYFMGQYPQLNIGYKLLDAPDMLEALNDFVIAEKVNIVTLNTRRRNIFGRIFIPSISRKILFKSDTALLVLRG